MNAASLENESLVRHLGQVHGDVDTNRFGVLDFASAFGSPLEALVYSKLFWPDFLQFEGMIFLAAVLESDEDRSRVRAALSRGSSRCEVEQSFNRFEIPSDFFASHRVPTTDEENLCLAERMAETWRARLLQLFPDKQFTVAVEHELGEPPTLTISQCDRQSPEQLATLAATRQ